MAMSDEDTSALNTIESLVSRIHVLRICDLKWIIDRMQYEINKRNYSKVEER